VRRGFQVRTLPRCVGFAVIGVLTIVCGACGEDTYRLPALGRAKAASPVSKIFSR
jgi:hypothetical protein